MQDGEGTLLRSRSQGGRRASASPRPWGPSGRASADGPANGRTLRMDNDTAGAGAPSFLGEIPESANVALWRRLLARQEFWVTFAVIGLGVAVTFVTSRFAAATNLGNAAVWRMTPVQSAAHQIAREAKKVVESYKRTAEVQSFDVISG